MTLQFSPTTFALTDVDEAMDVGKRVFYSHRVRPLRPRVDFAMDLVAGRVGPLTVGLLGYGSEVAVDCEGVGDYSMCIPLDGRIDILTPTSAVTSHPELAAIVGPVGSIGLRGWATGQAPALLLKFNSGALEAELGRMLGRVQTGPVHFAPSLDLSAGQGLRWRRLVDLLRSELLDSQTLLWNPLMSERLASTVISGLLLAADHQYREAFEARTTPASPAAIRRAATYIDEHLHEPITVPLIASAVGISVRTLGRGFVRYLSISPREYIERARLARVHADLISETPDSASVAEIASRWGFAHHSRFAGVYRAAYGKYPSEVLREG